MANTGYKGWSTLQEYYTDDNSATGNYKPNSVGDADYVAPVQDLATCPLPGEVALYPHFITISGGTSRVDYDFVIKNSRSIAYNIVAKIRNVTTNSAWLTLVSDTVQPNTDNNVFTGLSGPMSTTNSVGDTFELYLSIDGGITYTGIIHNDLPLTFNYDWTL